MSPPRRETTLKVAHKAIELKAQHPKTAAAISKDQGVSAIAASVLAARGFKPGGELKNYLSPTLKEGLPDPAKLKGLEEACLLIRGAVSRREKIAIACDFDVDGLSGGAQIYHFLTSLGALCSVFVPDRFADGYGLNETIVQQAAAQACTLLITVDYGTTNHKELELASSFGIRTIVVDHHHVSDSCDLPGDVFINPEQKGCGFADKVLSASGLAWYLLVGLRKAITAASSIDVREYLDLACLGTICDMVPLLGANRVMAAKGLELLSHTRRVGLRALKAVSGVNGDVTCHDVSFGLGPRINAAGRIIHGAMVIELLSTSDSSLARKIAGDLNKMNLERQEIELTMKDEAVRNLLSRKTLPAGIVVANPDFHTGVVGIVAQRLVELYYRPSVVLGVDTDGVYKGSVRGIKGFNVVEALAAISKVLIKFGGHEGAGGLSVEEKKLGDFTKAFEKECAARLEGVSLEPVSQADTEIGLCDVTVDLVEELGLFAPFGMGNPAPVFLIRNLRVVDVQELKSAHLKAVFSDGKYFIPGLLWRQREHPALRKGATVNIACRPEKSTYRGITELQFTLHAVEEVG